MPRTLATAGSVRPKTCSSGWRPAISTAPAGRWPLSVDGNGGLPFPATTSPASLSARSGFPAAGSPWSTTVSASAWFLGGPRSNSISAALSPASPCRAAMWIGRSDDDWDWDFRAYLTPIGRALDPVLHPTRGGRQHRESSWLPDLKVAASL